MKVAIFLALFVALACAKFTAQDYQYEFAQWMIKYQKSYTSEEFQLRFKNFKSNMDFVHRFNSNPKNTHTVGMNLFADLSNAEYQSIYLGTKINKVPTVFEPAKEAIKTVKSTMVGDNYNISVDWRAKGAVTGIKDQGQCGSCWSFSTTGSTEGAYFLKNGQLTSLSEQNLMDCSQAQGNMGCNGGLMDQAFQYIIQNKGIDTEASYPYTAMDGTCKFNAANIGATISSYKDVTSGSESDLETAANIGPVSVAIDASHSSFQLYTTGIYHEWFCSATKLDHGVLAVGYGTDTSDNKNFWIVKNSWGVTWGQQGYIYMSKDRSNNCGIATSASYPIA